MKIIVFFLFTESKKLIFIVILTFLFTLLSCSYSLAISIPVLNGPSIFSDSNGAVWSGNDLYMTIDPGVVNNPFAQVGTDYPERKIGENKLDAFGNRLLPENITGTSFDIDFDTSKYLWGFHVAAYQGSSVIDNGTIFVGNMSFPTIGVNQSGYLDKISDPSGSNLHLTPVDTLSTIVLSFDYPFFSDADRFFYNFSISTGAIPGGPTTASLAFSNIQWITEDASQPIPEPSTLLLFVFGVGVLIAFRFRASFALNFRNNFKI